MVAAGMESVTEEPPVHLHRQVPHIRGIPRPYSLVG